jgi:LytS/YehU family sensor histidine kinase
LLITGIAGAAASFYFFQKYRHRGLEAEVAQTQAQASHAKLKLLQTQLDPHLLFNTLANLRALITIDPQAALEMLDRMDAYLRATLSASRATEHPLSDEFARLEDYLELMKVRMGERLRYTLTLPSELAHIAVPSLILQPLVENSIKHGLEPKIAGGEVNVSAQWINGKLHLSVADTGVGMDAAAANASNGQGFGMVQLHERLSTRYGDDITIECIANKPEGTCVNMVFSVSK